MTTKTLVVFDIKNVEITFQTTLNVFQKAMRLLDPFLNFNSIAKK